MGALWINSTGSWVLDGGSLDTVMELCTIGAEMGVAEELAMAEDGVPSPKALLDEGLVGLELSMDSGAGEGSSNGFPGMLTGAGGDTGME
jgi:hypothetical protein